MAYDKLIDELNKVNNFLQKGSKEIVIIWIQHVFPAVDTDVNRENMKQKIWKMITGVFGNKLVTDSLLNFKSTLKEFRDSSKQVIALNLHQASHQPSAPAYSFDGHWAEAKSPEAVQTKVKTWINDWKKDNSVYQIFQLNWELPDYVFSSIMNETLYGHVVKDRRAHDMQNDTLRLLEALKGSKGGCAITLDFFEDSNLILVASIINSTLASECHSS